MDYKIVTPMALWQDFNPMKEPLEVRVDGVKITDKYIMKDTVFTVETELDGKIRAYANIAVQKNVVAPTVVYIPTGESPIKKSLFFDILIDHGFNIITIDYAGVSEKKDKYTVYPKSLEYCNFSTNRQLPYQPTEAGKSPWFVWTKVVRRAITLAFEESNVDKNNLFLLGYIEGAQLAWKTAGIDGRVRAVLPVGACGYTEFFNRHKYDSAVTPQFTDEWECWLAGISTQAYAKMLTCPVYYMSGTNSTYADIDRVADLFNLIPHNNKYLSFSAGTNNSITNSAFLGAIKWAEKLINGDTDIVKPRLKSYVSDGKLYASVTDISGFDKIEIYCALDELAPAFRSWNMVRQQTVLNNDEVLAVLVPREDSKKMFVYATVIYKDGVVLSTPEIMIDLTKIELDEYDISNHSTGRFIYNNTMDETPFSVENYNPVIDENILKVVAGPLGIKGVTVTEGKLCAYNVEPPRAGSGEYILQMEVYAPELRDIDIVMYTAENGSTKYVYKVHLNGSAKWQRVNMKRIDFKSADMLSLKDWTMVRKMKIKNAEGVLFSNILWI